MRINLPTVGTAHIGETEDRAERASLRESRPSDAINITGRADDPGRTTPTIENSSALSCDTVTIATSQEPSSAVGEARLAQLKSTILVGTYNVGSDVLAQSLIKARTVIGATPSATGQYDRLFD